MGISAVAAASLLGCSKDEVAPPPAASHAASVVQAPAPSAAPSATAPVASAAPTPSGPIHDCPKGSTGDATFSKPCEGKGSTRMMDVQWTGKMDDKGPSFRVTNKTTSPILYGKIMVYFYDKAGKQLEAKETPTSAPKPYLTCFGNMFGGVMKANEKAVITFSCFKKEQVPEHTTAIEGEMQMVGYSDASEKKVEYYWRNANLTPDARKKGGTK